MTAEIPPDPLVKRATPSPPELAQPPVIADVPPPPSPPPLEDLDFELPGMRFQKDGALKPGLSPSLPISGVDVKDHPLRIGHSYH